jgi:hypothetical protein
MLADVVARRTKCYGPRVELSPPPPETEMASAPHRQLVPLDVSNRKKQKEKTIWHTLEQKLIDE